MESNKKDFVGQALSELEESVNPEDMEKYITDKEQADIFNASKSMLAKKLSSLGLMPRILEGTISGNKGIWEIETNEGIVKVPWTYDEGTFGFGLTEIRKKAGIQRWTFDINGKHYESDAPDRKMAAREVAHKVFSTEPELWFKGRRYTYLSEPMLIEAMCLVAKSEDDTKKQIAKEERPDLVVELQQSSGLWGLEGPQLSAKERDISEVSQLTQPDDKEAILTAVLKERIASKVQRIDPSLFVSDIKFQEKKGESMTGFYHLQSPFGFDFKGPFEAQVKEAEVEGVNVPLEILKGYFGVSKFEVDFGDQGKYRVEAKQPIEAAIKILNYLYQQDPDFVYEEMQVNKDTIPIVAERIVGDKRVTAIHKYTPPEVEPERVKEMENSPWNVVYEDNTPFLVRDFTKTPMEPQQEVQNI